MFGNRFWRIAKGLQFAVVAIAVKIIASYNHMVLQRDVHNLSRIGQSLCKQIISPARRNIARGVIVHKYH